MKDFETAVIGPFVVLMTCGLCDGIRCPVCVLLGAFLFLLLPVKNQKIAWRKYLDPLTQFGRKMRVITCNEAYRLPSNGNLEKGLVAWVRQRIGKWRRSHNVATVFNMIKEGDNLIYLEPKLGTT